MTEKRSRERIYDMTSEALKFIPQIKAFAENGERNPSIPETSSTAMNLATGFPAVYSKPLSDGGKLIQRKEMNTLFYQLMLFQNFLQNGGYITWSQDVMVGIGGYPSGAVLSLIDASTGAETRVQSCIDNNYLQPTSESIGEKYKVNTSTVPHTYTKDEGGDVIWRYVGTGGGLWSDFRDKDFLFGSYLHMVMGPFQLTDGIMTGKIKLADRSNTVGWLKADANVIQLSKPVTDYKKLLFVFADEDGNENIDGDVQIHFQEIDVAKYCWLNAVHIEREDLFEKVKGMKKGETLNVTIGDTPVTYVYGTFRGAYHNYKKFLYPYPNYQWINNNDTAESQTPCFQYNQDYKTSIKFRYKNYVVAVIGLK